MSDVPVRDYIDTRFAEMEKRLKERFEAQEKALKLAVANSHWMSNFLIAALALVVSLLALFLKR